MGMKLNPLAIVLAVQGVVLIGAVGFLAGRAGHAAPVAVKHKKAPPPEEEDEAPELHPLVKPAKVAKAEKPEKAEPAEKPEPEQKAEKPEPHGEPAKLAEEKAEEPGEWKNFETKPEPAKESAKVEAEAPEKKPESTFEDVVSELVAGNSRFIEGTSKQRDVVAIRESLASEERASTVIVTCNDSRVVPEVMFDQPIGTFDVVRIPGAQVDDAAVKAVDEAVARLHAKAVLVLGHVGCAHVDKALSRAGTKKSKRPATLVSALGGLTTEEADVAAITFSAQQLQHKSKKLGRGDEVTLLRVLYTPKTGAVRWLDAEENSPPPPVTAARAGRR
jgi:carbonic anhydrase